MVPSKIGATFHYVNELNEEKLVKFAPLMINETSLKGGIKMTKFLRVFNATSMVIFLGLSLCTQTGFASSGDIYKDVYDSVDRNQLTTFLKNLTGTTPVTVDGKTFTISERYSGAGKQNFRGYFESFFKALNIPVQEMAYDTKHTKIEAQGHNVEAVLKG